MATRFASSKASMLEYGISTYLLIAYGVFLAGYFVTTNAVDHYKFLVGFLFIPGLLLLPRLFRELSQDSVFQLAAVYLLYLLASALWAETPDYTMLASHAILAGLILFFVAITAFLSATEPNWFDIIVVCAVAIAAGNALLSIILWDHLEYFTIMRLVGLGTMREPNSAGAVYGFYGLLAAVWGGRMESGMVRAALFAASMALLGFLLLTQARAATIACVLALTVLAALNRKHRPLTHLLVLVTALVIALVIAAGRENQSLLSSLSWDIRLELWADGISQIANAPLFGNGYLSGLEVYSETAKLSHSNVHNSYLAALRDGGIAGFALLAALLGAAVHRAVQTGRASGDYALLALLCFGLVYMLTSTDALITRPRELWVILWFPVGLLAGQRLAAGDSNGQPIARPPAP